MAFMSVRILGSNRDPARSALAAYVCRRSPVEGAPMRSELIYGFGAESPLRPPTQSLAALWDDVFSRRLSYGERICKAYELNQRPRDQDRIPMLPAILPATQYRLLVEDWVHDRFVPTGVSTMAAVHVPDHGARSRCTRPVRRRRS
jgi:hypothetical protein